MKSVIPAALSVILVTLGNGAGYAADPAAGKALAEKLCSGCHLVADGQRGPVADGVPSFTALARDPRMDEQALRGFIVDPHPPMPQVSPTTVEIDAIVAYIRSLEP